ncbi:hypothetical protein DC58_13780 [Vibrio navarrensis]|uniref:hypothetical protein n=1 Tax=Vibrio navarrensis TaxID=29495 RepID=UPI00052DB73A|nr:hypothetical protein [Vibrio navarrensis]KGK23148.1 hypothetical protein DC58_13780 [Vibrio navarrensis]
MRAKAIFTAAASLVALALWHLLTPSQAPSPSPAETKLLAQAADLRSVASKASPPGNKVGPTTPAPVPPPAPIADPIEPKPPTTAQQEQASPEEEAKEQVELTLSTTQALTSTSEGNKGVGQNRPPEIIATVQQALQSQIAGWDLDQGAPLRYTLAIDGLFRDPDSDALSTRVQINVPGLKLSATSPLTIVGSPNQAVKSPQLLISARDDHHGMADDAWVTARFDLPAIGETGHAFTHPLIGQTFYRLVASQNFAGTRYPYEVIYCEAWKLVNHQVYFAAANQRRACPDDDSLRLIGEFEQQDETLILTSSLSAFDAQQTWLLRKSYPSNIKAGLTNHLITVQDGNRYHTYTMLTDKQAMEQRLNVHTGQTLYQMQFFDYLFIDDLFIDDRFTAGQSNDREPNYVAAKVGNYIFERQATDPSSYQRFDSDLNIHPVSGSFDCSILLPYFDLSVVAGRGDYEDIVSYSYNIEGVAEVACFAFPSGAGKTSLAINHDYRDDNDFIEGEIYSYILRPKAQYAHLLEELKINLIYHHPIKP